MPTNFYMFFVAALIPFLLGAIWYGPLFGKQWMKINGFTDEYLKKGNMILIFVLSYVLCLMFSLFYSSFVIHQSSVYGLLNPEIMDTSSDIYAYAKDFYERFGDRHRTFGHGAAHGVFFSIFVVLPIIGVNALFERRGWKYTLLHWGYWSVTAVLVGGLLCQTLKFPPL